MPKETMTPRERWLAVLRRQKPDRVPMDYWSTDEAARKLIKYLGCRTRRQALDKLHIDYAVTVGPRYRGPRLRPCTDVYGCKYCDIDYGAGVYRELTYSPLAQYTTVEEIERNYAWPKADWLDYSEIPDQIKKIEKHPIRGGGSEPFLIYKNLRGDAQAFMDLIENPEIVHYCMDRLFDLAYENTRRIYETIPGKVTVTYVSEDMSAQTGLMFSPRQIHEFLLPGMKRIIDLAHQAGVYVIHHNDGNCSRILPDMIALGADALNPIQWRCPGMEREKLKQGFGDKLIFHGAMDNQYTLPFGTVDEVTQEVQDNLRILGEGGGYILAPCHNIQSVSPPENIVAMYRVGYEYGWVN